jgi:hypothetical protein
MSEESVERAELYAKVWKQINAIAKEAAPGAITPKTFAHVSVDIVLTELLRAGAIKPVYE